MLAYFAGRALTLLGLHTVHMQMSQRKLPVCALLRYMTAS